MSGRMATSISSNNNRSCYRRETYTSWTLQISYFLLSLPLWWTKI